MTARKHTRPVDLFRAHAARAVAIKALRVSLHNLMREQERDEVSMLEFLGNPGGVECDEIRYTLSPSGDLVTGPGSSNAYDLEWLEPEVKPEPMAEAVIPTFWPVKSLPDLGALAGPDAEPAPGFARLAEPDEIDRESA